MVKLAALDAGSGKQSMCMPCPIFDFGAERCRTLRTSVSAEGLTSIKEGSAQGQVLLCTRLLT